MLAEGPSDLAVPQQRSTLLVPLCRRFDPALQFLCKKVRGCQALGRIHRIATTSSVYPAASLGFLKTSGTARLVHLTGLETGLVLCAAGRFLRSVWL